MAREQAALDGLIIFLDSKMPKGNWSRVLRAKQQRKELLSAAKQTFVQLEHLAQRKFPIGKRARGVRFLPMSASAANFLNLGKSFKLVWIDGVVGTGFFLLGGVQNEHVFEPGVFFVHQGCPDRFDPREFREFPNFLLQIWVEAGRISLNTN
jgi:hypothetical protein